MDVDEAIYIATLLGLWRGESGRCQAEDDQLVSKGVHAFLQEIDPQAGFADASP